MLSLIHCGQCNDGGSYAVAFGVLRTALQLGFFALVFPLHDFFVAGRLEVINPLLDVGLCGFQLSAVLLDALFYGLQLCPHLPLGCLRLAVDFSLQLLHLFVDARELDAKIFTKLIDAFAHDRSPLQFW